MRNIKYKNEGRNGLLCFVDLHISFCISLRISFRGQSERDVTRDTRKNNVNIINFRSLSVWDVPYVQSIDDLLVMTTNLHQKELEEVSKIREAKFITEGDLISFFIPFTIIIICPHMEELLFSYCYEKVKIY